MSKSLLGRHPLCSLNMRAPSSRLTSHHLTLTRDYIFVDEAGMGAVAGPIQVAAVWLTPDFDPTTTPLFHDSKLLKPQQRKEFFTHFISPARFQTVCVSSPEITMGYKKGVHWATISIPPAVIDHSNAQRAWGKGILQLMASFLPRLHKYHIFPTQVLVDGIFDRKTSKLFNTSSLHLQDCRMADKKIAGVAMASIIARHSRDLLMNRLPLQDPRLTKSDIRFFVELKGYLLPRKSGPYYNKLRAGKYTKYHRRSCRPLSKSLNL